MRTLWIAACLAACSSPATAPKVATPTPAPVETPRPAAPEVLAADTPRTTTQGAAFIAPAGWSILVRGPATIVEAPEAGSRIALVDVRAADADAALAAAWAAYDPRASWKMIAKTDAPDKDGWSDLHSYNYQTSPNERRDIEVDTYRANGTYTVVIYDVAQAVGGKRSSQIDLIYGQLYPKGYVVESFAGKPAAKLDAGRIAELVRFVDEGRKELGIPGVSFGLIQDGKIVYAGGVGERELGGKTAPDADTLYIIASNTKGLTTLMLAKLVDAGKMTWDTAVTTLLPAFHLGDPETTKQVLVKHLICACTGMPRQDLEWIFEFTHATPDSELVTLGTMQPTSKFGEMFQYSNNLAAAGGFVGGHVAFPNLELGAAYDKAMQTLVFDPLGMTSTTFDFKRALRGNHATAHAPDIDGKTARATMEFNYAWIPLRPAAGAWSSVHDLLRYVQMELDNGQVHGKRYIDRDALLARRAPQVPIGKDTTYGMGLEVWTRYGVPVVHHGGDTAGYHSDMIWLPEQGVGAVILTNGNPGWTLRDSFRRKLLEVLFDGHPEADADVAGAAKSWYVGIAATRKLLVLPAAGADQLAAHYANGPLGEIAVTHTPDHRTVFDFGEWKSEIASRANPDGTTSFVTTAPGVDGFELVAGKAADGKRILTMRDAQHEYVFTEK